MPSCHNCGARISKFDTDICPVCGTKRPLDGVSSETVEFTSEIDITNPDFSLADFKHKKILLVLFCLIGFTGAPYFYLKYKKLGFMWLILNFLLVGGVFTFLFFLTPLSWFSLLIAFGFVYIINIVVGLFYYRKDSLKDGNNEFVK